MNGRNDTTVTNNAPSRSEFYVLQYSDGNSGVEEAFNTFEEAEDAGDRKWHRLSKGDRKKYSNKSQGAHFEIVAFADENGESWFILKDYTEGVE